MGANMSEYCQYEPRRESGKQLDGNQAPESKASLHDRGPVSRLSEAAEEITQRLEALKKYQADLKAGKKPGWRDKWQQAKHAQQTLQLQQKLVEASSAGEDEPKRQPAKFERPDSMVSENCEGLRVALDSDR